MGRLNERLRRQVKKLPQNKIRQIHGVVKGIQMKSFPNLPLIFKSMRSEKELKSAANLVFCKFVKLKIQHKFNKFRDSFAKINFSAPSTKSKINRLFKFLDNIVFKGQLTPHQVKIKICKEIGTWAGRSIRYKSGDLAIELSVHFLINWERLVSTFLHEMCHIAQWAVNGNLEFGTASHNWCWYHWAHKCSRYFPVTIESHHNWK